MTEQTQKLLPYRAYLRDMNLIWGKRIYSFFDSRFDNDAYIKGDRVVMIKPDYIHKYSMSGMFGHINQYKVATPYNVIQLLLNIQ